LDLPLYQLRTARQITAIPPLPWRIKGILPATGLATIFGPSTSGKSFLSIDIAASIALGNDWFGFRVKQAPVAYIALEGEGGFSKRLLAWEQANECKLPDNMQFMMGDPFDLTDEAYVRQLAAVIKRGSTIIIDTLNRAANGMDENSSKDMGKVLAGCKLLQSLTDGLVILIHHTGKDETKGLRGHSSLLAALDAAIEVIRDDELRSWRSAKNKDEADGAEFQFRLNVQFLGTDEDGDPITSCAIEAMELVPVIKGSGLKGNEKLVLDAINNSLQACDLLTRDDAIELAKKALAHVDSQHRANRAVGALNSLIKKGKLKLDTDTQLITSS
jgi:hypothetical protein